ncbi:hypothetical protein N8Z76_00270 [Gammaproteobacteria bacterium]|nr:hypothetical protein [Gammaproteobacteria bacterium]
MMTITQFNDLVSKLVENNKLTDDEAGDIAADFGDLTDTSGGELVTLDGTKYKLR